MKTQYVPVEHAAQTWPLVEKYIADALEEGIKQGINDYTVDQAKLLVCTGQWLLVVMADNDNQVHGAATITFINYPNSRVGYVTTIGGKLIANQDAFKSLCEILKSRGATKIQGLGRPAIVRLWKSKFGAQPISTLMELKL
jgi:hypothetical protein